MDRRLGGVAGALCAGRWPGLTRAADLACSAARPNGDGSLLTPVYAARSPRPADARQWASCRSEPGILSARTLRGSDSGSPVAEEKPDGSEAIALPLPVEEGGNGRRPCDFGKPCHGAQQCLGGEMEMEMGERDQWVGRGAMKASG